MATAKKAKPKPCVWAILNRDREIELYVGADAPCLDGHFGTAEPGTRFLGQLRAPEAKHALGFELLKAGKPVSVEITIAPKR
jgi:hypothetical protein